MALQVASLFGVLRMDDGEFKKSLNDAKGGMSDLGGRLQSVGGQAQSFGRNLTVAVAPLAGAFGVAVNAAMNYDEALTNIGAVTGKTRAEQAALGRELLAIGKNTRAGPQAVAEAFYDIAGGVADASTHMAILNASVATAEAGNADLGGTTKALISVMNSYGFAAEEAGFASDVLTQTVAKGVGSMDEFAAALPQVTGLANSLGISFDELGGMTAYLTTQGNTASQATTQLAAMMTALLNPNEKMKSGLQELGFSSGEAAIQALGLTGAYEALAGTTSANENGMAAMTGSVEALRGVTALTGEAVGTFLNTFTTGVDGATQAARNIQMESPAAQFDLLKSSISGMAIEVGNALLPAFTNIVTQIKPVIDEVVRWVGQNPQLVSQIAMITGVLVIAGPIIGIVGTAISAVGTALTVARGAAALFSGGMMATIGPILAVGAAVLGVIAAIKEFNRLTNEAASNAHQQLGGQIASGQITQQQLYDQAFKSTAAQFGGGIAGDIAARLFYTNIAKGAETGQFNFIQGHASGGSVSGGTPYVVGEQGPELFVPTSSGEIIPNGAMGGMQMHFAPGSIVVSASDYAGGQAAARGWWEQMDELRRSQG